MPSPTFDDVCTALADVLTTVVGLRAKGYADDQVNPPEAQVYTRSFDPRLVLGKGTSYGATPYMLGVRVFVGRNNARTAQKQLRDYMETTGDTSIIQAIEDGDNWSQTINYAEVTNIGQPFVYTLPGGDGGELSYWAVDFDVDVIW